MKNRHEKEVPPEKLLGTILEYEASLYSQDVPTLRKMHADQVAQLSAVLETTQEHWTHRARKIATIAKVIQERERVIAFETHAAARRAGKNSAVAQAQAEEVAELEALKSPMLRDLYSHYVERARVARNSGQRIAYGIWRSRVVMAREVMQARGMQFELIDANEDWITNIDDRIIDLSPDRHVVKDENNVYVGLEPMVVDWLRDYFMTSRDRTSGPHRVAWSHRLALLNETHPLPAPTTPTEGVLREVQEVRFIEPKKNTEFRIMGSTDDKTDLRVTIIQGETVVIEAGAIKVDDVTIRVPTFNRNIYITRGAS